MKYKNMQITENVHAKLKKYCKKHFLKMNNLVSYLILQYILEKEDEQKRMDKKVPNKKL